MTLSKDHVKKSKMSLVIGMLSGVVAGSLVVFVTVVGGGLAAQSNPEANTMIIKGLIVGLFTGCIVSLVVISAIRKNFGVSFYVGIALIFLLIGFTLGY